MSQQSIHFNSSLRGLLATVSLCLFCFWAGTFLSVSSNVPTPKPELQGPNMQHVSRHPSASRALLVMSYDAGKAIAEQRKVHQETFAARAPSSLHDSQQQRAMKSPADIGKFEDVALKQSGFSSIRPSISTGQSGQQLMRAVPFQVISWYPRLTYYPGFLSPQEAEHMVALAMKQLEPSGLSYRPGEDIPKQQEVRTSMGTFLDSDIDPEGVIAAVEDKIAAVTHLPVEHGEFFNVLRYQPGQHYDSHMDTFDAKEYGPQASQRVATFLIFLRAAEEGGETVFKREGQDGGDRPISDWRSCTDGLGIKVKPQQGDAVLFWSTTPDLQIDPHALHGACPVVKGEKWSAAKWLHDKPVTHPRRRNAHQQQ